MRLFVYNYPLYFQFMLYHTIALCFSTQSGMAYHAVTPDINNLPYVCEM